MHLPAELDAWNRALELLRAEGLDPQAMAETIGSALCAATPGTNREPTANCGARLDCGGACRLDAGHAPPCLCVGDDEGPGSCPA